MIGKCGKLPPKANLKTLDFSRYLAGPLPTPPAKVYREYKIPPEAKKMYGNDRAGDCTCAAMANLLINDSVHAGKLFIPEEKSVIGMYSAITGYDPVTGANDNGAYMTDVLEYMRTTGLEGHKILAWAKIDHKNRQHRLIATWLFNATYVGVALPQSAEEQFARNQNWEYIPTSPNIGGHAILHPGQGAFGDDYVTWAKWDQKASKAWSDASVDEEYAVVTEDMLDNVTHLSLSGFDVNTLLADLKLL